MENAHISITALRLAEERKRVCSKAQDWAAQLGMRSATISGYENGHSSPPADYLMLAAEHGVDVLYVLTGRREADLGDAHLSRIVTLWPSLPAAARKSLVELVEAFTNS